MSPLLTAADSNAVLVGGGHLAAYALFWGSTQGKLQGQIWQWLIEPAPMPGQKAPGEATPATASPGPWPGRV
jgi:hypothetical protein